MKLVFCTFGLSVFLLLGVTGGVYVKVFDDGHMFLCNDEKALDR